MPITNMVKPTQWGNADKITSRHVTEEVHLCYAYRNLTEFAVIFTKERTVPSTNWIFALAFLLPWKDSYPICITHVGH